VSIALSLVRPFRDAGDRAMTASKIMLLSVVLMSIGVFAFAVSFGKAEAYETKGWNVSPIGTISDMAYFEPYTGSYRFSNLLSSTTATCDASGTGNQDINDKIGNNLFADYGLGDDPSGPVNCTTSGTYYMIFAGGSPDFTAQYVYSVYYDGVYVTPIVGFASSSITLNGVYNTRFLDVEITATTSGGGGGSGDMIGSGWGMTAFNETFVLGADINGYPSYSNGTEYICHYNTGSHSWKLNGSTLCNDGEGENYYYTDDAAATPDLVTTWINNGGGTPVGVFTPDGGGSGTSTLLFDVSWFLDPTEINRTISAFNPTHVLIEYAPTTPFESNAYVIASTTGSSTDTFEVLNTFDPDTLYTVRVSFTNTGALFSGAEVPFADSYLYTTFTTDSSGDFLAQGDVENYNGLEPREVSLLDSFQLVACSHLDLFCQATNFAKWVASTLFVPSNDSITFVLGQRDDLLGKLPFSVFTEFKTAYDSSLSSSSASSSSLSLYLYGENVPVISTSSLGSVTGTGWLSGLRYLVIAGMWIGFAWYCISRIRTMFV